MKLQRKILELFLKYVKKLLYTYKNQNIWRKIGNIFTDLLYISVNTGRNLSITTGSKQLAKERRKIFYTFFSFFVYQA